jgi:ADP-heptose:LPS heptosyltransferase
LEYQASRQTALVTAAGGIGDILRMTPLVRVCAALGYEVDVLLSPDYCETASLIEGAPEIRRLFFLPSAWSRDRRERLAGLQREIYDLAILTVWSAPLASRMRARRSLAFDLAEWRQRGDIACARKIAEAIGWSGPLPPAFAIPSARRFDLPGETVALHPGCKPNWPWKKWHGFAELAAMLPAVAVVGTPADQENHNTYFRYPFAWPAHVQNFSGSLDLADTAALLSQCCALVSNDSGLLHLGVAVGTPSLGIFGLTSPERECLPAPNMFVVTKGLACEPACRQQPWGRTDCEHHLSCLKNLAPQEVFERLASQVLGTLRAPVESVCGAAHE